MRLLKHAKGIFCMVCTAFLWATIAPKALLAGDGGNDTERKAASANSEGAKPKIDAPAPLTERERWLLDRIEQLEKRVAELETKSASASVTGSNAAAAAPFPRSAGSNAEATAVAAPAAVNATTSENAEVEKSAKQEQTAAAKPAKAEPFAFADFTWLNGNARTKDLAMD